MRRLEALEIIYARLAIKNEGPGYCHFPANYPDEYFAQLCAEVSVTRYHKGRPRREWKLIRNRNEALDCRVYRERKPPTNLQQDIRFWRACQGCEAWKPEKGGSQ